MNFSTATGMFDFIFEGYFKSAGLVITRVPYRDVVAPLTDLGEGRIQAYVGALAIVQPHVQAGRVKLIAVTTSQRAPTLPDMPTVARGRLSRPDHRRPHRVVWAARHAERAFATASPPTSRR